MLLVISKEAGLGLFSIVKLEIALKNLVKIAKKHKCS